MGYIPPEPPPALGFEEGGIAPAGRYAFVLESGREALVPLPRRSGMLKPSLSYPVPCDYCDQSAPARDSRGRCRNCGAPLPEFDDRPLVMPIRIEETLNPGTR